VLTRPEASLCTVPTISPFHHWTLELPPHLFSPPPIITSSGDQFTLINPLQLSHSSSTRPFLKKSPSSISVNIPSSSVSLASLVGGTSQLVFLEKLLPGYKPKQTSTLKKKASGCFPTLSQTSLINSGSRSSPTITSHLTSAPTMLLNFPSPQTTHHLLHLWCPAISKQTSNPDSRGVSRSPSMLHVTSHVTYLTVGITVVCRYTKQPPLVTRFIR